MLRVKFGQEYKLYVSNHALIITSGGGTVVCAWFHMKLFALYPPPTTLVALPHRHAVALAPAPARPCRPWLRRSLVAGGAQVEKQWIPTSRGLCFRSGFPHALCQGEGVLVAFVSCITHYGDVVLSLAFYDLEDGWRGFGAGNARGVFWPFPMSRFTTSTFWTASDLVSKCHEHRLETPSPISMLTFFGSKSDNRSLSQPPPALVCLSLWF